MKQRIIGFDLARTYAIMGMFIVNFNIVFGAANDTSLLGKFLSLFNGNSSTVFVMLAGMGITLMTNKATYNTLERRKLKHTICKRALFLFVTGILLNAWWPADILHFYAGYMLISVLLLFHDKKYFLLASLLSIITFHSLLIFIPFETGWNFETLTYTDFYTVNGFLRNMFFNGWNAVFPWVAYFLFGMYLGKLNWTEAKTQSKMFSIGLATYISIELLQFTTKNIISDELALFINADYLPPFLPFILSTTGFGLMLVAGFMFIGNKIGTKQYAKDLAATGRMTLTHYILHLTLGMVLFSFLTGKPYAGHLTKQAPIKPIYILSFSVIYFVISLYFSKIWINHFKNGPFEKLMRKISG